MKKYFIKNYKAIYLIIALIITLFIGINGQYIVTGYEVKVGSPSPETFKAPRDIENKIETNKQREAAENSVSDLYKIDDTITTQVLNDINDFFLIVDEERSNYRDYEENLKAIANSSASDSNENTDESSVSENNEISNSSAEDYSEYKSKLETFLTPEQSQYLLTLPSDQYESFKTGTISIFENALKQGIKEDNQAINNIYSNEAFNDITDNEELQAIGKQLISIYLKPNLVVDTEATTKAKEEAVANIAPVMILKNQVIVSEGYIVSDEDYAILDELGYTEKTLQENALPIVGISIITLMLFLILTYSFTFYFDNKFMTHKEYSLLFVLYILTIGITFFSGKFSIYLNPILISVLLIGLFLDYIIGLIYVIGITIISSIILGQDLDFIFFVLLAGLVFLSFSKSITIRKTVFRNSLIATMFSSIIYIGISLLTPTINNEDITYNLLFIFGYCFISYIIAVGLIPVIEMSFGLLTQNKLLELSNPNNELIRKLTLETPGTYHHSLVVSNLAEAAAIEIGADYALARVGAYYHDIGKTQYPTFFTENQVGVNPHDKLSPWQSFKIIQNHVLYGIELGRKHKLPEEIVKMIPEHHGNSLIKFFYYKAKEEDPDVKEDDFRYGVSMPSTKESGILMLADTCEAAVRSMVQKSNSMEEIEEFVNKLIKDKVNDGQLVNSGLTIGDIENIKKAFMQVFKGLYHKRIEYPKTEDTDIKAKPIDETKALEIEDKEDKNESTNK